MHACTAIVGSSVGMSMSCFYDVIVVGAGVEGSATAYYLASRFTKNVLLLEQVRTKKCISFFFFFFFCKKKKKEDICKN